MLVSSKFSIPDYPKNEQTALKISARIFIFFIFFNYQCHKVAEVAYHWLITISSLLKKRGHTKSQSVESLKSISGKQPGEWAKSRKRRRQNEQHDQAEQESRLEIITIIIIIIIIIIIMNFKEERGLPRAPGLGETYKMPGLPSRHLLHNFTQGTNTHQYRHDSQFSCESKN